MLWQWRIANFFKPYFCAGLGYRRKMLAWQFWLLKLESSMLLQLCDAQQIFPIMAHRFQFISTTSLVDYNPPTSWSPTSMPFNCGPAHKDNHMASYSCSTFYFFRYAYKTSTLQILVRSYLQISVFFEPISLMLIH